MSASPNPLNASHYTHLTAPAGQSEAPERRRRVSESKPKCLGAWFTVTLASKKAPQLRDQADHGVQRWHLLGRLLLVQNVGALPLVLVEQ